MPQVAENKKRFVQSVSERASMTKKKLLAFIIIIAALIMFTVILPHKTASQKPQPTQQAQTPVVAPEADSEQTESSADEGEPPPKPAAPAKPKAVAAKPKPAPVLPDIKGDAVSIARAIGLVETGLTAGCENRVNAEGMRGCYQISPSTWRGYSKQVFGEVVAQTKVSEKQLIEAKVDSWLKAGLTSTQIFLQWNQGNPSPCKRGTNKYGVKYDSCSYVQKCLKKLDQVINSPAT